jgi:hypothetical protein
MGGSTGDAGDAKERRSRDRQSLRAPRRGARPSSGGRRGAAGSSRRQRGVAAGVRDQRWRSAHEDYSTWVVCAYCGLARDGMGIFGCKCKPGASQGLEPWVVGGTQDLRQAPTQEAFNAVVLAGSDTAAIKAASALPPLDEDHALNPVRRPSAPALLEPQPQTPEEPLATASKVPSTDGVPALREGDGEGHSGGRLKRQKAGLRTWGFSQVPGFGGSWQRPPELGAEQLAATDLELLSPYPEREQYGTRFGMWLRRRRARGRGVPVGVTDSGLPPLKDDPSGPPDRLRIDERFVKARIVREPRRVRFLPDLVSHLRVWGAFRPRTEDLLQMFRNRGLLWLREHGVPDKTAEQVFAPSVAMAMELHEAERAARRMLSNEGVRLADSSGVGRIGFGEALKSGRVAEWLRGKAPPLASAR